MVPCALPGDSTSECFEGIDKKQSPWPTDSVVSDLAYGCFAGTESGYYSVRQSERCTNYSKPNPTRRCFREDGLAWNPVGSVVPFGCAALGISTLARQNLQPSAVPIPVVIVEAWEFRGLEVWFLTAVCSSPACRALRSPFSVLRSLGRRCRPTRPWLQCGGNCAIL